MSNNNILNVSPEQKASLAATLTAFNEDNFVTALYNNISSAISDIEKSADKYYCEDEDKITNLLALYLRAKGYDATEQTKSNGDVDLTVRDATKNFYWLAEAKRGNSNSGVFEGMLQLVTRYLTDEKNAGFLIYYQKKDCLKFLKTWHDYINTGKYLSYKGIKNDIEECKHYFHINPAVTPLAKDVKFFDYEATKKSGQPVKIRNFIANLHHKPIDKSGRGNASLVNGQARLKVIADCDSWLHDDKNPDDIAAFFEALKKIHPEYFQ
ncbi:hypothetical protein [Atlantibacter sp. RC6]|uniref:hypothetical protein n=1 Tax=Atlantibacter sp. RC6 TaxID=2587036 RepID=UPI00160606E4|nr:hypothetical protein [Atlantibacter sp. RC6]MBB3324908.1 hypothetical protein [Atlantibacter sp. RC6]